MQYMVTGPDGQEYGPVAIDVLKVWALEDRVRPESRVRDFSTGQVMAAAMIPGLFPSAVPASANPYSTSAPPINTHSVPYNVPTYQPVQSGNAEFWGSIVRSVLA